MEANEFTKALGRRIRVTRTEKEVTAVALANAIGVTAQTISNIERGESDCYASTLKGICVELGTSADQILGIEKHDLKDDLLLLISRLGEKDIPIVEQFIRSILTAYHE